MIFTETKPTLNLMATLNLADGRPLQLKWRKIRFCDKIRTETDLLRFTRIGWNGFVVDFTCDLLLWRDGDDVSILSTSSSASWRRLLLLLSWYFHDHVFNLWPFSLLKNEDVKTCFLPTCICFQLSVIAHLK